MLIDKIEYHRGDMDICRGDCIHSINGVRVGENLLTIPRREILSYISNLGGKVVNFVISRPVKVKLNPTAFEPVPDTSISLRTASIRVRSPSAPSSVGFPRTDTHLSEPYKITQTLPNDLQSPIARLKDYRLIIHDLDHIYQDDRSKFTGHFLPNLFHISPSIIQHNYTEFAHIGCLNLPVNLFQHNDDPMSYVSFSQSLSSKFQGLSLNQGYNRSHAAANNYDLSLEVLCPHGGNIVHWYSPVLYCKHSMNIFLLDGRQIQSDNLRKLSQMLRDILAHSAEQPKDSRFNSKVLLLIFNAPSAHQERINREIKFHLAPYLDMLSTCFNGLPFIRMGDSDLYAPTSSFDIALQSLLERLRVHVRDDAIAMRYVNLDSIVASHLKERTDFVDRGEIRRLVEEYLDSSCREPSSWRPSIPVNEKYNSAHSSLAYIHNIGLAYVPGRASTMSLLLLAH